MTTNQLTNLQVPFLIKTKKLMPIFLEDGSQVFGAGGSAIPIGSVLLISKVINCDWYGWSGLGHKLLVTNLTRNGKKVVLVAYSNDTIHVSYGISVPINDAIQLLKTKTVRNNFENISAVSNNQSSSYLGESIISKKSQQTKNILVIIAMLAILIVAYLAVTGKLFKSLQS